MRALLIISSLLLLTSCYTKQQAIKKFYVPEPINIDSAWKINGTVKDSAHTAKIVLNDSCGIFKALYDSLINSGNFVIDTTVNDTAKGDKNNVPRATKWAVLYRDSVFTVQFRIAPNGQAQIDIKKHAREIPYQAQANFKKVINQPCPPPKEIPWWHKYLVAMFVMLLLAFGVISYSFKK